MEDLQGNICMLKTILETCDDKMTPETKKKVQNLIDVFTKALDEQKKSEMEVEYYYSVSEDSDEEEEEEEDEKSDPGDYYERDRKSVQEEEDSDGEEALREQMLRDWEEECKRQERDSDVGYPEFNLADEV